jgi:hypothetical protein
MADVEKRTTIVAGMNNAPMKEGLREIASEAAKTATAVTQSAATMGRTLLDASRGFEMLARKHVEGFQAAQQYAQAFQVVQRAVVDGRDKLGLIPTILTSIEQKFGLVSTAARTAAQVMGDTAKSAEERLKAFQSLLEQIQNPQVARPQLSEQQLAYQASLRARSVDTGALQRARDAQAAQQGTAYQAYYRELLGVDRATKSAADSASVFVTALNQERAAIDSVYRVSMQYEQGLAQIQEQMDKGNISTARGLELQNQLTAAYAAANAPLSNQVTNYDKLRASVDATFAASKRYEAELATIQQLQDQGLNASQADRLRSQAQERFSAANQPDTYDKLRRSIDPVYKASKEYEEELARVEATAKRLNLTQGQTQVAMDHVTNSFAATHAPMRKHAQSIEELLGLTSQQSFAMRQMGVQTVQAFSGIATGQPIMMTLIQQGHQMVDILLAADLSFRKFGEAIGRTFSAIAGWLVRNPITLAILAITAAIASLGLAVVRAEQAQSRMRQLQNEISAQRPGEEGGAAAQVEAASRHLAATTPLSREGAFEAASIVARSRSWAGTQQQMEDLIKVGENLRLKLGIELPEAMKMLTDAARDPAKAAEDAGHRFANFTNQIVQQITELEREGRLKEAMELFFKTMKEATNGAGENVSNLTKQWERFQELFTGDKTGLWRKVGEAMAEGLAIGLKAINDLIEATQKFFGLGGEWSDVPFTRKWWAKKFGMTDTTAPVVGQELTEAEKQWRRAPGAVNTGVSTAGALGIMQLMPGTAGGLGVNPFIPSENVMGGLKYIQQLSEQMRSFPGGLEAGISRAYLTGPHGNLMGGPATEYAGKVAAADISKLPTDTVRMIDYWATILGLPPNLVALGKRIAMVESGGLQLPSSAPGMIPAMPGGAPVVTTPAATTTTTTTGFDPKKDALQEQLRRDIEASNELARQQRANLQEQARYRESIAMQEQKLREAQASGDKDRIAQESTNLTALRQRLMTLQGLYTDLIEQSQRMARDAENAAKAFDTQAGAARDFEQIRQRYRDIARQTGRPYDEEAANREIAARQKELTKGFTDETEVILRRNKAQAEWLPIAREGSIALEHHIAQLQAEEEAIKAAIPGSAEYNRLVQERTEALTKEAQIKRDLQTANDNFQQRQTIDYLKTEIALLGESVAVRNRELAILRARQSLQLRPGQAPRSAEEAEKIRLAAEQADVETAAERIKAAYADIEQFGSQVFDTIGDAMVASFQEGADAAKIWQNALTSILNDLMKEFMKLAIVNPLKNALFGSNLPELGDVEGALGKIFGGGDKAANDNNLLGKAAGALTGTTVNGMPIDPMANAVRVTMVGPGGLPVLGSGDGLGGLPGLGGGGDGSAGGGSIASFMRNLANQDRGGEPLSGSGGRSGSGGGIFGSIFGGIGKVFESILNPGKMLDSIFGKGFYEGGGLFGSIFGGGGGGGYSYPTVTGGVSDELGGVYHSGGLIGADRVPYRAVPASMYDMAPRYAVGLGNNEFAAILHRSERVITANQNSRLENVLQHVSGGGGGERGGRGGPAVVMNITTPNADSFRSSQSQIQSRMTASLNRSQQRGRV